MLTDCAVPDPRHVLLALALAMSTQAAGADLRPLQDNDYYYAGQPDTRQVELGRFLFYDKLLSGNRNISCATCHHPAHNTGDGLQLSLGEGGAGLGDQRSAGLGTSAAVMRVGRNAQPLFNLGARQFSVLFHDGRVELDPANQERMLTPVGTGLPNGLDNLLAAQALFPVLAIDEMAGHRGRNDIADAVNVEDPFAAWRIIEARIRSIPEYVELMVDAYPHINTAEDIDIVAVANAIAAFTTVEWRADNSRFDAYLRGDSGALNAEERRGMTLFYGAAGCADCHAGVLQSDMQFHAIAMPQIGPGKGHGFDGREDFGRENVTGNPADRYRFRTPSLRNVEHSGPWGHSGAYNSLREVVQHHLDPVSSLHNYAVPENIAPARPDLIAKDFLVQNNPLRREAIASRNELDSQSLDEADLDALLAFLRALTDEDSLATAGGVPARVPSGLPVED